MWKPRKFGIMDIIVIFLLLFPCYTVAQFRVTMSVCEGDSHVIDCGEDHITISTAVYGRTLDYVCGTYTTTDCEVDVTNVLANNCNGQMQCTVRASNEIAGDPCVNTLKYLNITYTCEVSSSIGEETSIDIYSPNYPDIYDNNVDIIWQVIAPTGFRLMVQFTAFNLDAGSWNREGDSLILYHGFTYAFDDAAQRAHLSGSSLPDSISSIGSYLWLHFTTDDTWRRTGFSSSVSAVQPDWACDFQIDSCSLNGDPPSWYLAVWYNYYYIGTIGDVASFTIPYVFTASAGILSFGHYHYFQSNPGSLSVRICNSKESLSYVMSTSGNVLYEYIPYSCSGTEDIEITFTATNRGSTIISVVDIQLYERSVPSTASPSTVNKNTTPLTSKAPDSNTPDVSTQPTSTTSDVATQPASTTQDVATQPASTTQDASTQPPSTDQDVSTQPASTTKDVSTQPESNSPELSNQGSGVLQSAVIPAVSSVLVLFLIGLVIVVVFVYLRKRSRVPKTAGPVDQDDDDPNLYNNPVYSSKEDVLSTPDLLIGINSMNASNQSPAPHWSPDMDNQYEYFDGDTNATDKGEPMPVNIHSSRLKDSPKPSEINIVNSPAYYTLDRPSEQGDNSEAPDEERNHTYAQASWYPIDTTKGQTGSNEVYQSVKMVAKNGSSDGIAVLDNEEKYNALTFNQSSDITRALKKPMMVSGDLNNGYGVLDLPEDKSSALSTHSPELHNDDVYNSLNEPTVQQQNGKQDVTGERPSDKAGKIDQMDAESEYHNYQDPSQMDQKRSYLRPQQPDAFSSDQYNILDSGKQVGNYHVYQATDDTGGDYLDLESKVSGEDEYSTIDHVPRPSPSASGTDSFEPIYSDEVYIRS